MFRKYYGVVILKKSSALFLCLCIFLCGCSSETTSLYQEKTNFQEIVVFEDSDFRITATDIQYNAGNIEIKILVENNFKENATVYCDSFIVNDVMITALMWIDVSAGGKANGTIFFDRSDLQVAGIEQINTVLSYGAHISFDIRDDVEIAFSITENADYVQIINEEGKLLYSENGITIISKFESGKYSDSIPLLIKNESGQDFHIMSNNVTVNGYTIPEVHYYTPICDGTYRFFEIKLSSWGIEENEIDMIESASFSFNFMEPKSTHVIFQTAQLSA